MQQCDGVTRKGLRCNRAGKYLHGKKSYCAVHEDQAGVPNLRELKNPDDFDESKSERRDRAVFARISGFNDLSPAEREWIIRVGGIKVMVALVVKLGGTRRMLQVMSAAEGDTVEIGYKLPTEVDK